LSVSKQNNTADVITTKNIGTILVKNNLILSPFQLKGETRFVQETVPCTQPTVNQTTNANKLIFYMTIPKSSNCSAMITDRNAYVTALLYHTNFLIISDFVGIPFVSFINTLHQRPERAKYHSVGQRPTIIDCNNLRPNGATISDQTEVFSFQFSYNPYRKLTTKNFHYCWYYWGVAPSGVYESLS
jgi:hypothetical protein